ncbi:hypothetical protein BFP72_04015 [Reichenbachiella sp. 5M10]|nr:hypothetical protein BFP72_04015 [Reichenbachiella sp. 5M10]
MRGYFSSEYLFYHEGLVTDFVYDFLYTYHEVLIWGAVLFGVLASVGLLARYSLAVYVLLYSVLFYFDNSLGIYNHEAGLTIQILFVLIFAPGVQNWSLDRWIKYGYRATKSIVSYSDWGLKLVLLLVMVGYFTAGVSKIRYGGVEWLDGKTLQYYLSGRASFVNSPAQKFIPVSEDLDWKGSDGIVAYTYGNFQTRPQFIEFGKWVASNDVMMIFLSIATLIFELGSIFMLFWLPYRTLYLLSAVLFHFSIRVFMGLGFLDYQVICLALVDWKYVSTKLSLFFIWMKSKTT